MIPYGRQTIEEDDIAAVVDVLRSGWLTTGPKVPEFEKAFASFCGVSDTVAVSSGTAALHAAMAALEIGPGDEVIVPAMTFAASANCALFMGARPVFVDVDPGTLLIDIADAERRITPSTRAIIAVDYAGQPCDYDALRALCQARGLRLVSDACHAVGGAYKGRPVGSLADLSTFSFHPVKNMTTGEGGAITTDDGELAARMRRFRSHGVKADFRERMQSGSWFYEMTELGYNYRLTDFQCALGLTQLRKLPGWIRRRNEIAAQYDRALIEAGRSAGAAAAVTPLRRASYDHLHGYHLYMVRVPSARRAKMFARLREQGIGVNVHYIPVPLHPYYRSRVGTNPGLCSAAESAYEELITLPIFPAMTDADVERVIHAVHTVREAAP